MENYRYICVEIFQVGDYWKSSVRLNNKTLTEQFPDLILQRFIDSGGELVSTHFAQYFDSVKREAKTTHILWVRFPTATAQNLNLPN